MFVYLYKSIATADIFRYVVKVIPYIKTVINSDISE